MGSQAFRCTMLGQLAGIHTDLQDLGVPWARWIRVVLRDILVDLAVEPRLHIRVHPEAPEVAGHALDGDNGLCAVSVQIRP